MCVEVKEMFPINTLLGRLKDLMWKKDLWFIKEETSISNKSSQILGYSDDKLQ